MNKTERPFIVPVFIPHAGCSHRCIFCDQTAITGHDRMLFLFDRFQNQVQTFLKYKRPDRRPVQLAFYGGNFLGQKTETIRSLLKATTPLVQTKAIDSIRFSTRPDTIDAKRLDLLENYPVKTIEIGAQSMNDRVLKRALRGHTAEDTENAAHLLKKHGYEIGLQMMIGLPEDSPATSISSAERISALDPDFVRIYPTVVIDGSPLSKLFQQGAYAPLSMDAALTLTKRLYLIFKQRLIPVIRMGLQVNADLEEGSKILAGPNHPAFGHLVYASIFLDKAISLLKTRRHGQTVTFIVNPRSYSRLQGIRKQNLTVLKNKFALESIRILPDESISTEELHLF